MAITSGVNGCNIEGGIMKECTRCGSIAKVSKIANALTHFVCDYCRRDSSTFDIKDRGGDSIPITVEGMQNKVAIEDTYEDEEDDLAEREKEDKGSFFFSTAKFNRDLKIDEEERYSGNHRGHNVVGLYCWNCQRRVKESTSGLTRRGYDFRCRVVWKDGREDASDKCDICTTHDCKMPVHQEYYKERNK